MRMKKKSRKKAASGKPAPAIAACRGLGLCAAVTALLCALFAALIVKGVLPQQAEGIAGSIAAALAAFAGALLAAKQARTQKLLSALGMCAVFALILLMGNLLFVRAAPTGALWIAPPVILAGGLAGILGSRKGARRPVHRK